MTDESSRKAGVLVVEDERDLAELYASWLAERYDVSTALDGRAALEAYDETVDVVLLDRRMPGIDGDRVLDEIRRRGDDCRMAMISAVRPDVDVYEMGFDDYLLKPVSRGEINDLVERMLLVADYDRGLRRRFSLSSKLALLRTHQPVEELEASEEYAALERELVELDRELDDAVGEMSAADIGAILRDV